MSRPRPSPNVFPPGSIALAIVVALMFATPVLAATTLHPAGFRWAALLAFVSAHQFELILGFSLMIVIALLLKAATSHRPRRLFEPDPLMGDAIARSVDGLA